MKLSAGLQQAVSVVTRPVRRYAQSQELSIEPYRGYGSSRNAFQMGRVLRHSAPPADPSGSTLRRNLADLRRRLLRWGEAGATVRARLDGSITTVTTDPDGYFRALWTDLAPAPCGWRSTGLDLLGPDGSPILSVQGRIYFPPPHSRYVIISDIDDTVTTTGVANKAAMMWRLFFAPSESHVAFPGVAAFYRALHKGSGGDEANAMIYVSRAPWSIYEILETFFNRHRIPDGPILFLREWGLTLQSPLPRHARDHKRRMIDHVIDLYDTRKFILIGDSGQHDPEVYAQTVAHHPGRIEAIYIRDVAPRNKRRGEIAELVGAVARAGSKLVLAADTLEMARHAAEHGYISQAAVACVARAAEPPAPAEERDGVV